jgi:hypothetical protein
MGVCTQLKQQCYGSPLMIPLTMVLLHCILAAGAARGAASASFTAASQKQQIGRWSCAEQGFSGSGDIEQGQISCSPRPPRAQRG